MGVQFNAAYRKHLGGTRPLEYTPTIELDILFDVLNGCEMKCPGCYVETKNKFLPTDLEKIYRLTQEFVERGIEPNEIFLGPTDIFNTTNYYDVIKEPFFAKVIDLYAAVTFTSTMILPTEELSKKLKALIEVLGPFEKRFELFVVLDIEKYTNNDRDYLDLFDRNLSLIKELNHGPDNEVNIFFTANFYPEMFSKISLFELNSMIKKDYGTKFRINPSFARATNSSMVQKHSLMLKNLIEEQVNDINIKGVFLNMIDAYFGGETFHSLTYSDGKLYLAPFMYDFLSIREPSLEINSRDDGLFYVDDIFAKRQDLVVEQFNHSEELPDCKSCEFLPSCVSRHHIEFLKIHDIKDCIVPKKLFRRSYKIMEQAL